MQSVKNVMLTITEQCNLKCSYCFETNKSSTAMSFETARRIIETEMAEENQYDEILFDFMGGEPFVAFNLIKQICEYTWSKEWPKKYIFYASTNGTLVHGDILEWLRNNSNRFVCGLSLDGTPEVHNKNRSNSFHNIDIAFFRDTWPNQEVKMTISPEVLDQVFEGICFIHELGFRVKATFAYGPDWSDKNYVTILSDQLKKLIDYYVSNPAVEPATIINLDIIPVAYPNEPLIKWCGIGTQMVAYDVQGIKYPCHFFQGMSTGRIDNCHIWKYNFERIHDYISEKCKLCILRNTCPTCYGYNYSSTGSFGNKDPGLCSLTRCCAAATATLSYRRIVANGKGLNNLSDEDKSRLFAGLKIQQAAKTGDWTIKPQ